MCENVLNTGRFLVSQQCRRKQDSQSLTRRDQPTKIFNLSRMPSCDVYQRDIFLQTKDLQQCSNFGNAAVSCVLERVKRKHNQSIKGRASCAEVSLPGGGYHLATISPAACSSKAQQERIALPDTQCSTFLAPA